jgi:hypothetical protein
MRISCSVVLLAAALAPAATHAVTQADVSALPELSRTEGDRLIYDKSTGHLIGQRPKNGTTLVKAIPVPCECLTKYVGFGTYPTTVCFDWNALDKVLAPLDKAFSLTTGKGLLDTVQFKQLKVWRTYAYATPRLCMQTSGPWTLQVAEYKMCNGLTEFSVAGGPPQMPSISWFDTLGSYPPPLSLIEMQQVSGPNCLPCPGSLSSCN